ncbi:TolC family protein [Dysgonomonas sp. OttesenSCG-928-M03]|nr:TolC family protein [Dysgonomonas sp. OttesenSCG-928-M03]
MTKRNILWILLLICIPGISLYAQRTLSLDDIRNLAIQNNKELKMATEEEKVAYYQKKEAFLKYLPKLSANGTYLRNQKDIYLLEPSVLPPSITLPLPTGNLEIPTDALNESLHEMGKLDTKNIWIGAVSLTQPLFAGGRIVAYNDIMKNAEELARSQKDTQLQGVIAELDAAYWQVVSLADKKKLAESYLDLLKKMTSDISIMQEEGVATKADVLSVMVKMNEAEVALTKVDNGLVLSRMLLNQLCGLPIEEEVKLVDENTMMAVSEEAAVVPSIEEALQNRPEIKSLELATKIYKGKERVARAEFLPTVGFTANYLWTNPSSFNGFETKFGGMWNIGIALSIPLNIFTSSTKVNAAKAQTRIQEYKLEEAKEKIELQVNQSSFKLNEAYKKYRASQKNMEKADENLRYANVGFEEGVIPASDVLAAHTAWLSAHSELIDSQIDIKLSNVYLNKALGRSLNK